MLIDLLKTLCAGAARAPGEVLAISLIWMLSVATTAAGTATPADLQTFVFDAFGTAGVVRSSEDRADFTSSNFQANGAGYTRRWSPDVDSRIAGQITANITSQLSAVLQVISEQQYNKSFAPTVEWANLRYQFLPDASVRIGRIVLPTFLLSESRNLGYSNPWVRPPVELYSLQPVKKSDGADVSYRIHAGNAVHTLLAAYGETKVHLPTGGEAQARREWVLADTIEYGAATLHIAYQRTRLTVDYLGPLFDGFRQFGPAGIALADSYDLRDKPVTFVGVGGMYDPARGFIMGEWGETRFHSVLGTNTAWYVSGGLRYSTFTPYLTYAQVRPRANTSHPSLVLSALPPSSAATAEALNSGLNAVLAAAPSQRTISIGSRWDFARNLDLKLQFDHSQLGPGSPGTLSNVQPGFHAGGVVNLLSITLDFVL